MRADPKVEVTYRNKTVKAIAREAGDDENRPSGTGPEHLCGVRAYASRIKNREIRIMILSAEGLQ